MLTNAYRLGRLNAAVLSMWLLTGDALAQAIPEYDPSFVPDQFRMTAYAHCGIGAAADPVWPTQHRRFRDANGAKNDEYLHILGVDFWKRDKRVGAAYSENPHLRIQVQCNDTALRPKAFKAMVASLHKTNKSKRGQRWSGLKTRFVAGVGELLHFQGEMRSRDGDLRDVAHAYLLHNNRIVWVMIQIGRESGKDLRDKTLRAGSVVEVTDSAGRVERFRVTRKATQAQDSAVGYLRGKQENRAFIETIIKSIRPI